MLNLWVPYRMSADLLCASVTADAHRVPGLGWVRTWWAAYLLLTVVLDPYARFGGTDAVSGKLRSTDLRLVDVVTWVVTVVSAVLAIVVVHRIAARQRLTVSAFRARPGPDTG